MLGISPMLHTAKNLRNLRICTYTQLIHEADPQSRLVVITIFVHGVCISPLFKRIIVIATGGNVGQAEWIIDGTLVLFLYRKGLKFGILKCMSTTLAINMSFSRLQIEVLNKHLFITAKPMIYLVNLSEKDFIRKKNKWWVLQQVVLLISPCKAEPTRLKFSARRKLFRASLGIIFRRFFHTSWQLRPFFQSFTKCHIFSFLPWLEGCISY